MKDGPAITADLRSLLQDAEQRLVQARWQAPRVSVSVVGKSRWATKRRHVTASRRHLFESLLRDAVIINILCRAAMWWEPTIGTFLNPTSDGAARTGGTTQKLRETYDWLVNDLDAPTEYVPPEQRARTRSTRSRDGDRSIEDTGDQVGLDTFSQ